MKAKLLLIGLLFWGAVANAAPFVNLDFEQASTNSVRPDPLFGPPYFIGPATDLLPGWQVFRGVEPVLTIDVKPESSPLAAFHQGVGHVILVDNGFALERISLAFCCVDIFQNPNGHSIVQRGDVPSDATVLEFNPDNNSVVFAVYANDQLLSRVPRDAQDFSRSVFDISDFAGQNVELRLTTFFPAIVSVHSLSFGSIPIIPEPSPVVLAALGVLGICCARRWQK